MTRKNFQRSILFCVYQGSDFYSIPLRHMGRTFDEKACRSVAFSKSHCRRVSDTQNNISTVDMKRLLGLERISDSRPVNHSLLIIENTEIRFLVESVLGAETLHSWQNSGPIAKQLIRNRYSCDDQDELVLGLDVPCLLSIC